jgi:hypothetical protein
MNLLPKVEQKAAPLIAHFFHDNSLLGELLAADGAYDPFTGGKLPENPAIALWRDGFKTAIASVLKWFAIWDIAI